MLLATGFHAAGNGLGLSDWQTTVGERTGLTTWLVQAIVIS